MRVPLARRLRNIPSAPVAHVGRKHPLHPTTGSSDAERRLLAVLRQIKRLKQSRNGNSAVESELKVLRMMRDELEAAVVVQQRRAE